MESDRPLLLDGGWGESRVCGGELCGDEVACNVLSGFVEGCEGVVAEELSGSFVGASDFEEAAGELDDDEVVEPFAGVCGVERFDKVEYVSKDFGGIGHCQSFLLLCSTA